jgi:hypothetical protein
MKIRKRQTAFASAVPLKSTVWIASVILGCAGGAGKSQQGRVSSASLGSPPDRAGGQGEARMNMTAHDQEPRRNETTEDRTAVLAAVNAVARGADERRWDAVRAAFAPRVVLDYGVPELLTPDEIVARWRPLFAALDRTKHEVTPTDVRILDADRAGISSTFTADHWMANAVGGDQWTLSGRYEHEVIRTDAGWKVSRMRMIPGHTDRGRPGRGSRGDQVHRQRSGIDGRASFSGTLRPGLCFSRRQAQPSGLSRPPEIGRLPSPLRLRSDRHVHGARRSSPWWTSSELQPGDKGSR